jgi:hypothetical protein
MLKDETGPKKHSFRVFFNMFFDSFLTLTTGFGGHPLQVNRIRALQGR